jgi:ribose transport system permease protein
MHSEMPETSSVGLQEAADPANAHPDASEHEALTSGPREQVAKFVSRAGLVRFSAVYVLAALIFIFWEIVPYFLTVPTLKVVLIASAITGLVALGAIVPFSAGVFDIQFGYVAGFALVLLTWLSNHVKADIALLVLATVVASTLFGVVSGWLVAKLKGNPLVVTLGVGTLALAAAWLMIGSDTVQATLPTWYANIGQSDIGPIPVPVFILLIVAVGLHVWLEHTAGGRTLRLIGNNPTAAWMAGVNVGRYQLIALAFSSLLAGLAGVIWCAQIGFGNSSDGGNLTFPAIAAILLGSTQFRDRINVPGTILAVLVVQTAAQGLNLKVGGSAEWPTNLFSGVLLLVAVAIVAYNGRRQIRVAEKRALAAEAGQP